jgi:hypothetical protein
LGRGVTTLFISPSDVRYRTRNYYQGNKDWVFNVASGTLVMIDHDRKQYAESDAEEREEVRRLEREEAETRRLLSLRDGKIEMQAIPPAHPGKFLVEKGSETRRYAGYECEQYVISTDAAAGPQEPNRRDRIAVWWVTGDLQAPAFFKFQDAVIEEEDAPDIFTRRLAWAQAYDELKRKGLFPLGLSPAAFMGGAPTFEAPDMLFRPTSWGAGWIRKGPDRSGRLRDRAERLNPVRRIASELQQDPLAGRDAHREPEGQDRVEQEILAGDKRQIERHHVDREAAAGAVRPDRSFSREGARSRPYPPHQ